MSKIYFKPLYIGFEVKFELQYSIIILLLAAFYELDNGVSPNSAKPRCNCLSNCDETLYSQVRFTHSNVTTYIILYVELCIRTIS